VKDRKDSRNERQCTITVEDVQYRPVVENLVILESNISKLALTEDKDNGRAHQKTSELLWYQIA
jgi:hypothetical protein